MLLASGSVAAVLAAKNSSGAGFANILFLVVIVVGAYLLFLRPARNRQRRAMETRSNVAPGVEVVTTAGLIGTVVEADDETVTLEIAPQVHARFLRQAIARVVVPPQADETIPPEEPAAGADPAPDAERAPDAEPESGDTPGSHPA